MSEPIAQQPAVSKKANGIITFTSYFLIACAVGTVAGIPLAVIDGYEEIDVLLGWIYEFLRILMVGIIAGLVHQAWIWWKESHGFRFYRNTFFLLCFAGPILLVISLLGHEYSFATFKKKPEVFFDGLLQISSARPELLWTRMKDAVETGDVRKVKWLIDVGVPINQGYEPTLIKRAEAAGHLKVVEILKAAGAPEKNPPLQDQSSPLEKAIKLGDLVVVNALVTQENINTPEGWRTPLWMAAENGNLEIVQALVEKGASLDGMVRRAPGAEWLAPLDAAIQNQHHNVALFLFQRKPELVFENADLGDLRFRWMYENKYQTFPSFTAEQKQKVKELCNSYFASTCGA